MPKVFFLENDVFSSSLMRFSSCWDLIGCRQPEYSAFVMSAPLDGSAVYNRAMSSEGSLALGLIDLRIRKP